MSVHDLLAIVAEHSDVRRSSRKIGASIERATSLSRFDAAGSLLEKASQHPGGLFVNLHPLG